MKQPAQTIESFVEEAYNAHKRRLVQITGVNRLIKHIFRGKEGTLTEVLLNNGVTEDEFPTTTEALDKFFFTANDLIIKKLNELFKKSEIYISVFMSRYEFSGEDKLTFQEAGEKIGGFSRQYAHQIRNKVLYALTKYLKQILVDAIRMASSK